MANQDKVFGMHAVQALLKTSSHRINVLYVLRGRRDQKFQKVVEGARKANIRLQTVEKKELDVLSEGGNHQGLIAFVEQGKTYQENDLYSLIENTDGDPFILVLDGVTDPHNLGACLRSADAAGVNAVVIPKDNSAGLNETARKVASGAADIVPLIPVTNLARCLKKLQDKGLWVSGLAGEAEYSAYDSDLAGPRVIVMGAEGAGLRRLTKETCDTLVSIPMFGTVSSLNVSVATGIILFETVRQRMQKNN